MEDGDSAANDLLELNNHRFEEQTCNNEEANGTALMECSMEVSHSY